MKKRALAACAVMLVAGLAFALCGCTETYKPTLKSPTIEAEALHNPGTLTVGVDASSYPFAGESNGRITGLNVDVAAALADQMGLKLEVVDVGVNSIPALGESVDIVMSVDNGEVAPEDCWMSEPYTGSAIALFAKAGTPAPTVEEQPVIGAQTQSLASWTVTDLYGAAALKSSIDLKGVFQGVKDGTDAYAASDLVVGSYLCNSLAADMQAVGLMEEPSGYCVGVSNNNAALQQAVSDALAAIRGNGVLNVVLTRWMGAPVDAYAIPLVAPAQQLVDSARQAQAEAEARAAEEAAAAEAAAAAAAQQPPVDDGYIEVGANAVTEG